MPEPSVLTVTIALSPAVDAGTAVRAVALEEVGEVREQVHGSSSSVSLLVSPGFSPTIRHFNAGGTE